MALFAAIWLPIAMVPGPSTARDPSDAAGRPPVCVRRDDGERAGAGVMGAGRDVRHRQLVALLQVAYDAIRVVGAGLLIVFGLQSLLGGHDRADRAAAESGLHGVPGGRGDDPGQ